MNRKIFENSIDWNVPEKSSNSPGDAHHFCSSVAVQRQRQTFHQRSPTRWTNRHLESSKIIGASLENIELDLLHWSFTSFSTFKESDPHASKAQRKTRHCCSCHGPGTWSAAVHLLQAETTRLYSVGIDYQCNANAQLLTKFNKI